MQQTLEALLIERGEFDRIYGSDVPFNLWRTPPYEELVRDVTLFP